MQSTDSQSVFQRALDIYIKSLPEKKKHKAKFVATVRAWHASATTPESINESIKQAEEKNSSQAGRRIATKILNPVVNVLKSYDDIISSLASADPMPTAIIWGALKIVIDGADRSFNLFDTIKKELRALTRELERINDFEHLYGDSNTLQELFCNSYINMIRFWSRVDKECETSWYTGMLKATTPLSTNKLNKIIKDIQEDADEIVKFASILEATKGKAERQAAELERSRAARARAAEQKERDAQAAWREENERDRQGERYHHISSWLCARQGNEDNMRQWRAHKTRHLSGTCEWLLQHRTYIDWRDGHTSSAIFWVHAPPGAGKSILSSRVIQAIKEEPDAALAYHFYRFDQMNSGSETLRLLASQLFDAYWSRTHAVSEEMYLKTQQSVCSLESVEELVTILVKLLPKSYFMLDGLDEEVSMGSESPRWSEAVNTLDFLIALANGFPDRVRLWYSTQYRSRINEKFREYVVFDIQDKVKDDVTLYLSRANLELRHLEVSDQDRDHLLKSLQVRAEGNFLWASLMLKSLKPEEVTSLKDMKQFVKDGLPKTLDEYYRRIFDRFETPQRSLVSKIFALVAFARRPLRMRELREAVGLLQSPNPRSLDPGDMPFPSSLRTLLPPLIEMQEEGCTDPDDFICRLFHSTLRDFLSKNPTILQRNDPAAGLLVNPDVIATACLLYLAQARYARPLKKHGARWVDAAGASVDRHQFHPYAAKYWDKHLDAATPSDALENRVASFITSSNFQTCIQVQSLWVDAQFGVFRQVNRDRIFLRRMFPAWFVAGSLAGMKLWRDFRVFLHEWKYFLHCPRFGDPDSVTLPYTGELDRCWWPALGPHNFLSKFKCKYTTFRFQKGDILDTGNCGQCFEGVGADGKEVVILRLASRKNGALGFTCERWSCTAGRLPKLQRTQTIATDERKTNWLLYVKHSTETSDMRVGRAWPAAFSQENNFLRIGAQLFSRDSSDDYVAMPGFNGLHASHPSCVEEFASRGHFTAFATRRLVAAVETYDTGLTDDILDAFGANFLKMETTSAPKRRNDAGADSDSESSHYSDSSSEPDDAGYETWSQCSTEHLDGFGDDIITPWAGPASDMDGDTDSDPDLGFSGSESSKDDGLSNDGRQTDEDQGSGSDSDVEPSAVIGYGVWHDDDNDNAWYHSDSEDGGYGALPALATLQNWNPRPHPGLEASITIFDSSSQTAVPMKVFHFARPLPFLLYDSPPAIHPSKSLLVWPLSAGDVLFVDFLRKAYFIRKLRPSTSQTRHIFMKCRFSPCGLYLHFASLEGQKKTVSGRKKKSPESEKPPVKLALLVSTYRLSVRKTSRSPPTLVHRARLDLGAKMAIPVSKLPYTLTWMPEELYFTCSDSVLTVFRIPLFNPNSGSSETECPILVPRKPIFLPQTAERREVYYFPPDGDDDSPICRIIIGSETRARVAQETHVDDEFFGCDRQSIAAKHVIGLQGTLSPPVGCYLDEQTDLGGWSKSSARSTLPRDLGIGQLDRRLERFDPEDDCDLEAYVF
ncbi:hypothetical protein DFH09DRAFT_560440 [Mycena vulgaris]|nr:hypothetical protein DFH09DRAFT_560440 [Mycena vulgaris]